MFSKIISESFFGIAGGFLFVFFGKNIQNRFNLDRVTIPPSPGYYYGGSKPPPYSREKRLNLIVYTSLIDFII